MVRFPFRRCTLTAPKLVLANVSPPTSRSSIWPFPVVALTPLGRPLALMAPNDVSSVAFPLMSRTLTAPFESSTTTLPPTCSSTTSPKVVFTYTSLPVALPVTFPFEEVHFTYPLMFRKLMVPKLPFNCAPPLTVSASIEPLLLLTVNSPCTFLALTEPNELLIFAAPLSVSSTAPLPPLMVTAPVTFVTVMDANRSLTSRVPFTDDALTVPLVLAIVTLPSAPLASTDPKEFASLLAPPSRKLSCPWLFSMSAQPRTPAISTLPKPFFTHNFASLGTAMS